MKRKYLGLYGATYYLWLLFFVLAPVGLLVYQSFLDVHGAWTWENYRFFLTSPTYLKMAGNSFLYAFLVTGVTLVLAYPAAYFLTRTKHKRLWLLLAVLPTWMNLLLKAYAFIGLLSQKGWINQWLQVLGWGPRKLLFTQGAFLWVAAYIELPFMLMPIFHSLDEIPSSLLEAATDLGASPWTSFWRVLVPLSMGGVKSGIQAVFIPSLSLFMVTRLIGGNRVITLGTAVEQHFLVTQNWGMGASIGVILMLGMVLIMWLTRSRQSGGMSHD